MLVLGSADVELVRLAVILMKEEDGLGGEEVDVCNLRGLRQLESTSLTAIPSL